VSDADIQVVEQTSQDGESAQMITMAKLAAQTLTQAYPNHMWMIGWAPGMTLVVKYGQGDSRYGYTLDAAGCHSISHFEKLVRNAGGELLERLGLRRGAWDGEDVFGKKYEGATI
jgi:hypothetical protein